MKPTEKELRELYRHMSIEEFAEAMWYQYSEDYTQEALKVINEILEERKKELDDHRKFIESGLSEEQKEIYQMMERVRIAWGETYKMYDVLKERKRRNRRMKHRYKELKSEYKDLASLAAGWLSFSESIDYEPADVQKKEDLKEFAGDWEELGKFILKKLENFKALLEEKLKDISIENEE